MRDPFEIIDDIDINGHVEGGLTVGEALLEIGNRQLAEQRRLRRVVEGVAWVAGLMLAYAAGLVIATSVRADEGAPSWWLNAGGVTYHQHADRCNPDGRRCANLNPGLGIEYRFDDAWSAGAMAYHNSQGRTTPAIAAQWMPLQTGTPVGTLKAGITAAVFWNYRDENDHRRVVGGPLPTFALDGKRVAVQALIIPATGEKRTNAIALQFKVAL